ncbi:MAG: DUF1049 domain-containing protein [Deltaproteobacteria bacterium]|nr:DUF1049 domain-containing protein [Deltaproteobacteria bacterium]
MRYFKLILAALAALLGFLLIRQNMDVLTQELQFRLNLYFWTFESSGHQLWILLVFFLFVGFFVTGLYSLMGLLRMRRTNHQLHHDLEVLRKELQVMQAQAARTGPEAEESAAPQSPV